MYTEKFFAEMYPQLVTPPDKKVMSEAEKACHKKTEALYLELKFFDPCLNCIN